MGKLNIGSGDYLDSIPTIALDSTFGSTITEFSNAVKNNFNKIISLPFLQGEPGSSIEIQNIDILGDQGLNALGKAIFNSIYSSTSVTELDPSLDENIGGEVISSGETYHSYSKYEGLSSIEIPFYTHIESTENGEFLHIASQQLWFFLDARVKYLDSLDEGLLTEFKDLSCGVSITGFIKIDPDTGDVLIDDSESEYTVIKYNVIPTLYYTSNNSDGQYWAWNINGEETGISAQGKNGEDGENSIAYICEGEMKGESTDAPSVIEITKVFSATSSSTSEEPADIDSIPEGALCVVWYIDKNRNNVPNVTFGNAVTSNNNKVIYVRQWDEYSTQNTPFNFDFRTMLSDQQLRTILDDLNHTEDNPSPLRGIYLRDKYEKNGNTSSAHLIWANQTNIGNDNSLTLHLEHTSNDNLDGSWQAATIPSKYSDTTSSSPTTIDIHYDKIKKDYMEAGRSLSNETVFQKREIALSNSSYSFDSLSKSISISLSAQDSIGAEVKTYLKFEDKNDSNKKTIISSQGVRVENGKDFFIRSTPVTIFSMPAYILNSKFNITNTHYNKQQNIKLGPDYTSDMVLSAINAFDSHSKYYCHGVFYANSPIFNFADTTSNSGGNLNCGTWWKGNRLMFLNNFIQSVVSSSNSELRFTASEYRPRRISHLPVKLGGVATVYNSSTKNLIGDNAGKYLLERPKPLSITNEVNYENSFMSGKFGWSNLIELSSENATQETYSQSVKTIETPKVDANVVSSTDMGMVTSCAGTWTKIGNVIDVKGKLFVKAIKRARKNDNSSSFGVPHAITYEQFYNFLKTYGSTTSFPLPLVVENLRNPGNWSSTGNTYPFSGEQLNTIILPGSGDINKTITTYTLSQENELLNGTAQIFLNSIQDGQIQSFPSVVPLTASLKTSGREHWTFDAIPAYISLTNNTENPSSSEDRNPFSFYFNNWWKSKFQNFTSDPHDLYHFAFKPIPIEISDNSTFLGLNITINEPYDLHTGIYNPANYTNMTSNGIAVVPHSDNTDQPFQLDPAIYMGKYPIKYITFQFSYLLDDDVYSNAKPHEYENLEDKGESSANFDYDSYDPSEFYNNIAASLTSEQINEYANYAQSIEQTDSSDEK